MFPVAKKKIQVLHEHFWVFRGKYLLIGPTLAGSTFEYMK